MPFRLNPFSAFLKVLKRNSSKNSSSSLILLRQNSSSGYEHFSERQKISWGTQTNLYVFGSIGCAGMAIYVSNLESIPFTDRQHLLLLSVAREKALGIQNFQQVLKDARSHGSLLPEDHPVVKRVRYKTGHIGLRIAEVADDGYGGGSIHHMKSLDWEFAVINEKDNVNAFVVPGGKVVVYSGLLLNLIKSDDELAAVLAHEVAHVVARHTAEKITELGVMVILKTVLYAVLGISLPLGLGELMFSLPNSRRCETEADIIGMRLMSRACFNPEAAISVLRKLDKYQENLRGASRMEMPDIFRTHPITSDRVSRAALEVKEAKMIYQDSGCVVNDFFNM